MFRGPREGEAMEITQQLITSERSRLERALRRVNGATVRREFRAALDGAAGRYALGRLDETGFRAVVGELVRDAEGTAVQQDREADRTAWATMPRDGSGRLTLPERITYSLIGAACAAALVLLAWTTGLIGGSDTDADAPAQTVPVSVVGTPAGPGTPDADAARELIIEGAWLSWQAYTECGEGPAECDAVLREVNANPYGVHFFEDGSAVDPARN